MNATDAYTQQAATTASPAQLVLMLYDGALARVADAERALVGDRPDLPAAHTALTKAQAIVRELAVTLDHERGGPVAGNLAALYSYLDRLLVEANLSKDPSSLPEVRLLLGDLREVWEQACVLGSTAVA